MQHMDDMLQGPGNFEKITTDKGIQFYEKKLTDGRGMILN